MDENTGRRKLNRQQIFNTLVDNEKSNGIPLIDCKHNYRSLSHKLTLFFTSRYEQCFHTSSKSM